MHVTDILFSVVLNKVTIFVLDYLTIVLFGWFDLILNAKPLI